MPIDVCYDRKPQFTSHFWSEFCRLLGATASLSSGCHPQSNGRAEQMNQEMETTLRCLSSRNPSSLSEHLWWSIPTTSYPVWLPGSHRSSVPQGIDHPCSRSMNGRPSMEDPSTWSIVCSDLGDGARGCNTWLTGKLMVQRCMNGFPLPTFSISP